MNLSKEIMEEIRTGKLVMSSRAAHVLMVMTAAAKKKNEPFNMAILEISEISGLSVNPIQSGIKELIELKLIKKETGVNKKSGKGATYTVLR